MATNTTQIGDRVRLIYTNDPYTNLKTGDEGVVTFVDDIGTVFVNWDSGSRLGMVPGHDLFAVISA